MECFAAGLHFPLYCSSKPVFCLSVVRAPRAVQPHKMIRCVICCLVEERFCASVVRCSTWLAVVVACCRPRAAVLAINRPTRGATCCSVAAHTKLLSLSCVFKRVVGWFYSRWVAQLINNCCLLMTLHVSPKALEPSVVLLLLTILSTVDVWYHTWYVMMERVFVKLTDTYHM